MKRVTRKRGGRQKGPERINVTIRVPVELVNKIKAIASEDNKILNGEYVRLLKAGLGAQYPNK